MSDKGKTDFGIEAIKWLAIVTMTLDHISYLAWPEQETLLRAVGRLAYPAFAYLVATASVRNPGGYLKYAFRLLILGVIAQPIYAFSIDRPMANVLFTLAAGAFLVGLRSDERVDRWSKLGISGLVLMLSAICEYGPLGVAVIVILSWRGENRPSWRPIALASGLMLVLTAASNVPMVLMATLALPIIRWSHASLRVPGRGPRYLYYAYYPAHLLVLGLLLK